jgi:hypothetical protein
MKTRLLILSILLTLASCTNEKPATLDQSKKDSITKEIETAINQILADWNTKDINIVYSKFLNSPDFTFIAVDGSLVDYASMIESSKSMLNAWKDIKYNLVETRIKIKDQNLVLASIIYGAEVTYPDGKIEKYPKVGSTFVFSKINDKWTVIHFQESSLPPETINPEKNSN